MRTIKIFENGKKLPTHEFELSSNKVNVTPLVKHTMIEFRTNYSDKTNILLNENHYFIGDNLEVSLQPVGVVHRKGLI